jgi:hypothetical protein
MIFRKSWPERGLKMKMAPSKRCKRQSGQVPSIFDKLTDWLSRQISFERLVSVWHRQLVV